MLKTIHVLAPYLEEGRLKEAYLKVLFNTETNTLENAIDLIGNAEYAVKLLEGAILDKVKVFDLIEYFSDKHDIEAIIYKLSDVTKDIITGKTNRLDIDKIEQYIEEGYKLIDVREADEYSKGHIPNAENIPISQLEYRLDELNREEKYIVYCNSSSRSAQAEKVLKSLGFDVSNLDGSYAFYKYYNR